MTRVPDEADDLTPEEEMSLTASLAEAERGDLASEEEIAAIWARHRL